MGYPAPQRFRRMTDDDLDQRIPGRLVVLALICLYIWGVAWLFGFASLGSLAFLTVLLLLVIAILLSLAQGGKQSSSKLPEDVASQPHAQVGFRSKDSLDGTRES